MRVMVTGGTGFVGSHCVRALHAAGHEVVLLAREQARVAGAIEPLGVPADACEVVVGDLLEPATVDRALDGVDAVLHAANVYSLNARDAELMQRVNVEGTSTVLTAAAERGLDPIVHVSSGVVLLPSEELTSSSPVGDPYGPYSRSKVAAEAVAQQVRDAGGSVVITYPGAVYGPHQPHLGESASFVRSILRGTSRLSIRGGLGIIDARDLALAHARLFSGHERDRYLMSGRWVAFEDIFRTLEAVVAHRLPRMRLPGKVAFAAARAADAAQRRGIDPGFSSEATWIVLNWPADSDDAALRELGVVLRPFVDTLRDTVAWLHEQGRVSRRQAGAAADHDWARGEPPTSYPA